MTATAPVLSEPMPRPTARTWAGILVALCGLGVAAGLLALAGLMMGAPPPVTASPFGVGFGEAAPATGGIAGWLVSVQSTFHARMLSALGGTGAEAGALMWLSLAYGAFHAAGPGHGKAVVAGYLLAGGADLRRGLAVSTAAALLQALVAIGLVMGLSVLLGTGAAGFRSVAGTVESASFALVACVGLWLLARKSRDLAAQLVPGTHACGPGCAHIHEPPARNLGPRALAGTILAAGTRPCSGAILVLVYAISRGMPWTGVCAVLAMAAGTALTTGLVAAMAVYAKGFALRLASGRGSGARLALGFAEVVACAVVAVLGTAVLLGLPGGLGALLGG